MARFCASCGAQVPDDAVFCASCGKAVETAVTPVSSGVPAPAGGGLADNLAGMLAYVTIIPAIVFLVLEPYNKKLFVRFHAFQSIFFCVAWTALWIVLGVFGRVPFLGILELLIAPIVGLAGLVIWILLLVKAYQGQMWKLPVIGDMAAKQANTPPSGLRPA